MSKQIKTGVQAGAGLPPGYVWAIEHLDIARREAMGFLSESQYHHLVDQIKSLAGEVDPTHPLTVDVKAIEDFFELRDKGGPLGKINVRVFFFLPSGAEKKIVILGSIKKEAQGATPVFDKMRMARRKRKYLSGDYDN